MDGAGIGSFEQEWPELARRLKGALARRRVSACLIDDIVQETGFRLFKMWDQVDPDRSPWGLTLTIAKNLLWDELHRRGARELLIEPPERATHMDVEDAGIARLELWRVGRALLKMSPAHRAVLLAELGDEKITSTSQAATKMMRMRARRRLTALLDTASASALTVGVLARKWAFQFQQFVRRNSTVVESPAPVAMAAVLGAVMVMTMPSSASPAPRDPASGDVTPAILVNLLSESADDGWKNSLAKATIARSVDADETASKKKAVGDAHTYEVAVGDDKVGGEATLSVTRKKNKLIRAPHCDPPNTTEPGTVSIHCEVETGDEHYDFDARVRVNP
ncbi:MAG TPA: sigma factor [Actinomycetota bacterium]|nr:sigma factor [Actinomycetota bacterium]